MIVVPHTSWWDFFIGVLTRGSMGMKMNYVAKKELFRFPFGTYLKWMGGAPLDRTKGQNKVEAIAEVIKREPIFRLAIAPEGTRKKVTEWKTGFYYIAIKAGVPIIPVAFDYGKKEVKIGAPFYPTGDITADLKIIRQHYKGVSGKNPRYNFDVE